MKSTANISFQLKRLSIGMGATACIFTYYETHNILISIAAGFITATFAWIYLSKKYTAMNLSINKSEQLGWQKKLKNVSLPAAIVDLNAFDHNAEKMAEEACRNRKTIRIATKSLRVPYLIERVFRKGKPYQGLMCYSVKEAQFLYQQKMNDILIAYPSVQPHELEILRKMHEANAKVTIVVDSKNHLVLLENQMQGTSKPFPVVVEIDMSLRLLGGLIHLGARRSPIRTLNHLRQFLIESKKYPSLKVNGAMAYEAVVAGLPDNNPFKNLFINFAAGFIRKRAVTYAANMCKEIPKVFSDLKMSLDIFNTGGTGTLGFPSYGTEITVGSGFLAPPQWQQGYSNLKLFELKPAIYFALSVVRSSDPDHITCAGGGYIASGDPHWGRLPQLVTPGLKYLKDEGAGEVQTPLKMNANVNQPPVGSFVLFQPAKAGELAEHFNEYHLIENEKMSEPVKTYRGFGQCFL